MRLFLISAALMALAALPASHAADRLITKKSHHNVATTLDWLEAAIKEKGINVVARVNHGAAAGKAGLQLRPTELLIFGNPKLGTPLMQSNQQAGIDLPLKVLAWEDEKGQTWVGYVPPQAIADRRGIRDRDEVINKMTSALDGLTSRATQP